MRKLALYTTTGKFWLVVLLTLRGLVINFRNIAHIYLSFGFAYNLKIRSINCHFSADVAPGLLT